MVNLGTMGSRIAIGLFILAVCMPDRNGPGLAANAQSARRRPNILLIVTDDQRPDTIRALGNKTIYTPTLDSLVRNGTTFTRAIAPNPLCTPSRAELMTGCCQFSNGPRGFMVHIKPGFAFWGQTMRDAGYHGWHVGKWMNFGSVKAHGYEETQGLFRGGAPWKDDFPFDFKGRKTTGYGRWGFKTDEGRFLRELGVGLTPETSKHIADAAIHFINRKPTKPFFLHVNFPAPHDPLLLPPGYEDKYNPDTIPLPPNYLPKHPFDHGAYKDRQEVMLPWPRTPRDIREEIAAYYAVISHMDEHIGRILAALKTTGQEDDTIVIFTSDNGEAIGSHGLLSKKNMYEHTVGVPLIFKGPRIPKGERRDAQCYLRDLFPTVCDLTGIKIPATVEGRSLVRVIRGEENSVYPHIFGYHSNVQRMIRTNKWKLIHYPKIGKYQFFDLSEDPYELHDLAAHPQYNKVLAELRAKLKTWQKRVGDPLAKTKEPQP